MQPYGAQQLFHLDNCSVYANKIILELATIDRTQSGKTTKNFAFNCWCVNALGENIFGVQNQNTSRDHIGQFAVRLPLQFHYLGVGLPFAKFNLISWHFHRAIAQTIRGFNFSEWRARSTKTETITKWFSHLIYIKILTFCFKNPFGAKFKSQWEKGKTEENSATFVGPSNQLWPKMAAKDRWEVRTHPFISVVSNSG